MHIAFDGYEIITNRLCQSIDRYNIQHYFGETDMNEMSEHAGALTGDFKRLSDRISKSRFANYQKKLMFFTGLNLRHHDLLPPMLLLSLISTKLINSRGPSIDDILWRHAMSRDIPVAGLETFEEQLAIFHRIPYEYQLRQLKQVLGNLSKTRLSLIKLVRLYQTEEIHTLYMQGKKSLGPIRDLLLKQRNSLMTSRIIDQMASSSGNCFFSFGAAHLAGEHGIIHGLKKSGVQVHPIT